MIKTINIKRILSVSAILLLAYGGYISAQDIIGRSVEKRPIYSYTIQGTGPSLLNMRNENKSNLILIGGIHGGYEWNSVILVRDMLDHYSRNTDEIPSNIILHIIPVLNPDGLYRIAGEADPALLDESALRLGRDKLLPGRLNANLVDLNRNFDNGWQPVAYHGITEVSAGSAPFSEPESAAIRDLVDKLKPSAVLFIHSASNNIWYGGLPDSWEPAKRLAEAYSKASGYKIYVGSTQPSGVPFTGTASGYLYNRGIPGIIIELSNRYDSELERNIRGFNSLMQKLN